LESYCFDIHLGVLNGKTTGTFSTLESSGSINDNQTKNYFGFYDSLHKNENYGASIEPVFYLYPVNRSNIEITIAQLDSVIVGSFSGYIQSRWNIDPPIVKHVTNGKFRVVRR